MTQDQEERAIRYCPRCGGRMQKPVGSTLYWHADNNHPRCDITNIVDTSVVVQASEEPLKEPPTGKGERKKK